MSRYPLTSSAGCLYSPRVCWLEIATVNVSVKVVDHDQRYSQHEAKFKISGSQIQIKMCDLGSMEATSAITDFHLVEYLRKWPSLIYIMLLFMYHSLL